MKRVTIIMKGIKMKTEYESEKPSIKSSSHGHGQCEIYGCPRMGQIYTTGWNCRYHHGVEGGRLASITTILRNHQSEIDWYEKVLASTITGFDMGMVGAAAPDSLKVLQNETFSEYKLRLEKYVDSLLHSRELATPRVMPLLDRKSQAAGEVDMDAIFG